MPLKPAHFQNRGGGVPKIRKKNLPEVEDNVTLI